MGFRDEFFFTQKTYAQWSLERTVAAGFQAERLELRNLRKSLKASYEAGAQRIVRGQAESSAEIRRELAYQANRLGRELAEASAQVTDAIEHGSADIVSAIQRTCDYLGGELIEIRWAVERHAKISEQIFQVLLNSLDNKSRQYFEQGVKCYETGESGFAKERFAKALEENRTNYFAWQYLGFLAVAEENPDQAVRNFELAQKFAEQPYHRALALSHLARARRAIGDAENAVALAQQAASLSPETAKFWYELAGHHAKLNREDEMATALRMAIERDWNFWTVVCSDVAFDSLRLRVNTLLELIRRQEAGKAQAQLKELKMSLDTARTVQATTAANQCGAAVAELQAKFEENNIFLHLAIQREAPARRKKTLEQTRESLDARLSLANNEMSRCRTDKHQRVRSLSSEISRLRDEQDRLDREYKPLKMNCFVYVLACFICILIFVSTWGGANVPPVFIPILCFAPFFIPPLILWILNMIGRASQLTGPKKDLERRIQKQQQQNQRTERDIDQEFQSREAEIQRNIDQLQRWRSLC